LPGGAQLLGCPLGPGVGAEFLEKRERRTQVRPCLDPVTGAPQMLTKGKFGTGTVEKPWRIGMSGECTAKVLVGVPLVEQRATMSRCGNRRRRRRRTREVPDLRNP